MKKFPERWIKESGSPDSDLSDVELESLLQDTFAGIWLGKSVLAIIPDLTRDDPTPLLFPKAASMLFDSGVEKIDVLVAQGTHSPMTVYEKRWKTGLVDYPKLAARIDFFDHKWDDSGELASIGEIEKDVVIHLSGGLLNEKIAITVNKRVVSGDYDSVLVFSSTVPHEVAGFSGGAKISFPAWPGRN